MVQASVLWELQCLDQWSRAPSIKTRVAEAERKDKPVSQAVHLDRVRAPNLQNSASQECREEEEMRSWMATSDSSFRQEEVALATGGGKGKLLLRPTSTTDSLVWATCSTWEAMFRTVEVVVMAIIIMEDSTTTMGDSTTTMEDSTTMGALTTTME